MPDQLSSDALAYHRFPVPGKLAISAPDRQIGATAASLRVAATEAGLADASGRAMCEASAIRLQPPNRRRRNRTPDRLSRGAVAYCRRHTAVLGSAPVLRRVRRASESLRGAMRRRVDRRSCEVRSFGSLHRHRTTLWPVPTSPKPAPPAPRSAHASATRCWTIRRPPSWLSPAASPSACRARLGGGRTQGPSGDSGENGASDAALAGGGGFAGVPCRTAHDAQSWRCGRNKLMACTMASVQPPMLRAFLPVSQPAVPAARRPGRPPGSSPLPSGVSDVLTYPPSSREGSERAGMAGSERRQGFGEPAILREHGIG